MAMTPQQEARVLHEWAQELNKLACVLTEQIQVMLTTAESMQQTMIQNAMEFETLAKNLRTAKAKTQEGTEHIMRPYNALAKKGN